ncbi:S-methyl-5-thioribose-1-phosphate isomerase [Longispora sp. NPDC051575]|uniref:S-methyl-5-thioribose-1-phosphate isomerase n=1 Tax=Longispora sp. NPDC051575 TaxID=3154943 RepID=UPI0034414251
MEQSLDWDAGGIIAVDQTALPDALRILRLTTVDAVIDAIGRLAIRGAPAIGLAGALGVALAAHRTTDLAAVRADAARLAAARPTARNLAWGVERALTRLDDGPEAVLAEALTMVDEDEATNRTAAARAADVLRAVCPRRPLRLLTHCNTGRFATAGWGTALGAIRELAAAGEVESVLATETRPLLQGARLTTWELREANIPHYLCVDSAAASAMARGMIDGVLVGADRIARNGDTANKIGTYSLALAAARHGIPFIVVAPESTVDETLADGSAMVIEERAAEEVTRHAGRRTAPDGTAVYNPAFDVTPADLITAVVTESRLVIGPDRQRGTPGVGGALSVPPASVPARLLAPLGGSDQEVAEELVRLAWVLHRRGWMDGTAGNLSARAAHPDHVLITASGRSKDTLTTRDLVTVHAGTGRPTRENGPRPSAETAIHAAVYRTVPGCGAVVHAHPPHATALAARAAAAGRTELCFADFEIIKGLGVPDPSTVTIPVFPNWPDVSRIGADVAAHLAAVGPDAAPVLLIGHHGATAWGPTPDAARNRLESLEALCRLTLLTAPGAQT